jgi:hypothetical protein
MFLHWWVPVLLMMASVLDMVRSLMGRRRGRRRRWLMRYTDVRWMVRLRWGMGMRRRVQVGRTRVGMRRWRMILARRWGRMLS